MVRKFVSLVIARRFWVILLVAVLTLFFALQIKNLRIVIDPNTMLPQEHPNVIGTNLAERVFGSKHVVVIGVSAEDGGTLYRREVLEPVARLTEALSGVEGVTSHTMMSVTAVKAKSISGVDDELRVDPLLPLPMSDADIASLPQRLAANPIYGGTVVSADGKVASISFAIKAGQGGFRQIMDRVDEVVARELAASPGAVRITLSGTPVFFASVERFAQRMAILFPIALLIIGLIHFEAFRTVQGLLLPLVTAILAVIWGLGIMGLSRIPMDAFNATTPILILAVAAGHAVQILKRYYEEYDRTVHADPDQPLRAANDKAILASLSKVAPVMITAGSVAALGFFSLITFDVATIRTFGIFTGLGILSALFIELTFIPALRSYLRPPKVKAVEPVTALQTPGRWERFAAAITTLVIERRKMILIGFVAIAALSALGLFNINRENSTKSYFGDELTVREHDRFLNTELAGTNTLYVVFEGASNDSMKDPALLRLIEESQRHIETLPEVGKTASIVDFIKQMNRSMNGGAAAAYVLPDSQDLISQYLLLYSMSGDPTDFDAYIDYDYRRANLTVWMKSDSSSYAATIVNDIRNYVQPRLPAGVTLQIGGSVPQSSALSETLVEGKMRNIAQIIFVVFLAGVVVFRSLFGGIYLIVPLLVTVLINFGVMGLTGIPLNTPNSVSSAMAIGIGADYAIYMLYRLREELARAGGDLDLALRETMRTAGQAVIYVATAIAGGYSVLLLSFDFYVHIWFGILIVLSMVVSAASALILVPALVRSFPPRFLGGRGAAAAPATTAKTAAKTAAACVVVATALAFQGGEAQAQTLSADAIMEKNYHATRLDSSITEATFKLINASGQERVRKTFGATKLQENGVDNRRVIRFLSPSDVRNTTTLMVENSAREDEVWVYLPAMKKVRRLASNNKRKSFVGTDLSYGDMIGHKPGDWRHTLLREEPCGKGRCYVVESLPKSAAIADESGYSKRLSWVSQESFVALKADLFDTSNKLLKTAENSELELVDAPRQRWQARFLTVKNHQTGHTTQIRLEQLEANVDVPESYFSTRYLEKEE